jgi:hypothetical protein
MEKRKPNFEDFIITVGSESKAFVEVLHEKLVKLGCKIEVKSAKKRIPCFLSV